MTYAYRISTGMAAKRSCKSAFSLNMPECILDHHTNAIRQGFNEIPNARLS